MTIHKHERLFAPRFNDSAAYGTLIKWLLLLSRGRIISQKRGRSYKAEYVLQANLIVGDLNNNLSL